MSDFLEKDVQRVGRKAFQAMEGESPGIVIIALIHTLTCYYLIYNSEPSFNGLANEIESVYKFLQKDKDIPEVMKEIRDSLK